MICRGVEGGGVFRSLRGGWDVWGWCGAWCSEVGVGPGGSRC